MGQNGGQLLFLLVIAAAFWLLLIRPQQQRAKQHAELIAKLAEGDEILTIGGMYAVVTDTSGDRLRVRVADGSELELARGAVGSVVPKSKAPDAADDAAEKDESA